MGKLLIIGLDCAEPDLVFNKWLDDLPSIKHLVNKGLYGPLKSTVPPITVPAWTAMMSSQDPGMLGFYGFRNRKSYNYEDLFFANASYVKAKTLWNHFSRKRMRSLVFGVPQTYPPKPLNGMLVSCFLTPDKNVSYTYPDEVKAELEQAADGNYIIDVEDFRTERKEELLDAINVMTERRFKAFRHFYRKDSYDFAIMVEMGIDRIHHAFWRYSDKAHRLYEPGNQYENVIHDYYVKIDGEIERTIDSLPADTSVMIVSDHGAKTMVGAICINEWLQREGYLTLKENLTEQKRFKINMVDWSKTKAWGEGGYYSRIFMNVKDREPNGLIPRAQYEAERNRLKTRLEAIEDENGKCINTKVFKPEEVYRSTNGIPPDLVVYLGNLDWRSAGSVGVGSVYLYENDTGPDDANHAEEGIFVWDIPGRKPGGRSSYSIYDIAPSVLKYFNIDIPEEMIGKPVL